MTSTLDTAAEWTADDSDDLDAEILATYGRRHSVSGPMPGWKSRTLHMAALKLSDRGARVRDVAEILKISIRSAERWTTTPVPPRKNPVRPCVQCTWPTRPNHAAAEEYPDTRRRVSHGLCTACASQARRALEAMRRKALAS